MNYDKLPEGVLLDEAKAQEILDRDGKIIVEMLIGYTSTLTTQAKANRFSKPQNKIEIQQKLPLGWEIVAFASNAISVHYIDPKGYFDKDFYVPSVFIYFPFHYVLKREPILEIIKRYRLGFCSCGAPIPEIQLMIKISENTEKGGINKIAAFFQNIKLEWMMLDEISQSSVVFNRARCCL